MTRYKKPGVKKCIVTFCQYRNYPIHLKPKDYPDDLSFFKLSSRKQEWLRALGKDQDMSGFNVICSIHFRPEDIVTGEKNDRRCIKPGAVPSQFLRPSELIKTPKMFQIPDHLKDKYNITAPVVTVSSSMIPSTVRCVNQGLTADRHDNWMRAIGRDPTWEHLSCGNRICSKHFLPEDLTKTSTGWTVKKGAVPKINTKLRNVLSQPYTSHCAIPQAPVSHIFQPHLNNLKHQQELIASRITETAIEKNSRKIKKIKLENIGLQKKIDKVNNLLETLGDECNISEISKQLIDGPSNIIPNVEDSSTESETETTRDLFEDRSENIKIQIVEDDIPSSYVSAIEKNNEEVITIEDDEEQRTREEQSTRINCLDTESQVQITFLAGSDTAKEGLLKRKLKLLAENDIIKSKKIRDLNNIIFVKNKVIDELKEEINKLKNNQQNLMQMPIFKFIHTN